MRSNLSFEIRRWFFFFLYWLVTTAIIILILQVAAVPFMLWLFNDIPYALPSWHRIGRLALVDLFVGFFAGTVNWYYDKSSSDR